MFMLMKKKKFSLGIRMEFDILTLGYQAFCHECHAMPELKKAEDKKISIFKSVKIPVGKACLKYSHAMHHDLFLGLLIHISNREKGKRKGKEKTFIL